MAEQIEFEEVESGNSGASEDARENTQFSEEVGNEKEWIHCYVVFSEEISLEDGEKLISEKVLGGKEINLQRRDESGHAIVVILNRTDYEKALELSQVQSIQVMQEAELMTSDSSEMEESISTETDAYEEEVRESDTQIFSNEYETETLTTEVGTEYTIDEQRSFLGNHVKGIRLTIIVVIILIVTIVFIQQKRRW